MSCAELVGKFLNNIVGEELLFLEKNKKLESSILYFYGVNMMQCVW